MRKLTLTTRKMDNILSDYLKRELNIKVKCFMGTDFAFYYNLNRIEYSIVVSERMDNLFLKYAKNHGLKVDCGIFLLSFFHEVGHYMTLGQFTLDEIDEFNDYKDSLTDSDEDCKLYFNVEDERKATLWAIQYINNNEEKVGKLALEFQNEMAHFIEKYNIAVVD